MIDVGSKPVTRRTAEAGARVQLGKLAFSQVQANKMKKGDVLTVAQLAGILGAKHTATLIPLCHQLPLDQVHVTLTLNTEESSVDIVARVATTAKTGVEIEALTAASIAALTVYDMCKAVNKAIVISDIRLHSKTGGRSMDYLPNVS